MTEYAQLPAEVPRSGRQMTDAGDAGILAPTASAMLHNVSTLVFSLMSTRPLIGEEKG